MNHTTFNLKNKAGKNVGLIMFKETKWETYFSIALKSKQDKWSYGKALNLVTMRMVRASRHDYFGSFFPVKRKKALDLLRDLRDRDFVSLYNLMTQNVYGVGGFTKAGAIEDSYENVIRNYLKRR